MSKKWVHFWERPVLAGVLFLLSAYPAHAQYSNVGSQFQYPLHMVAGVNTQLSLPPGFPAPQPPVLVYGSYVWSQTNGTNSWPFATCFVPASGGYATGSFLAHNSTAANTASVTQLIQDHAGMSYYLTSEFYKHSTTEGGVAYDLVGYYLQGLAPPSTACLAPFSLTTLAYAPVRLVLDDSGAPASPVKIFVLENDTNNHAFVEKFTFDTVSGVVTSGGYQSLPAVGAPVDIGLVASDVIILGNGTSQGSGGALYVLDENLNPTGPGLDYTPNRADGYFVALKGFARDQTDGVEVEGSTPQFFVYGDVLALSRSGPPHIAYYVAKHSTSAAGFIEGTYPSPVPSTPVAPPPSDLIARSLRPKITPLMSSGSSTGAVRGGGVLYVTGTASPNGYNVGPTTVSFQDSTDHLHLVPGTTWTHPYPISTGIALDTSGKIYVGAGGQTGTSTYVLAFQSYDPNTHLLAASGQWSTSLSTGPTSILLRRHVDHLPEVFLGGSVISPDSSHMYAGIVTEFAVVP